MNGLKYKKEVLIEKLKFNKDKHVKTYEKAWEVFTQEYSERLEEMVKDSSNIELGKAPDLYVDLAVPQSHEDDYSRVILMVELSSQEEFHLTEQEFRQYIMDEWYWREAWLQDTVSYSSKV